jgi:dCTP deaminase
MSFFKSKITEEPIDITLKNHYDFEDFFEPIQADSTKDFTFKKGHFYIMNTKERVCVPIHLSSEMAPFSHNLGELRAHYAGFFDPGWGVECSSGKHLGTTGVLEIRTNETISVSDGQFICKMEYLKNNGTPEKPYGMSGNHYHMQQGPRLAKFFKQ